MRDLDDQNDIIWYIRRVLSPVFPVKCPRSAGTRWWLGTSSDRTTIFSCSFMTLRSRMRRLRSFDEVPNGCHPSLFFDKTKRAVSVKNFLRLHFLFEMKHMDGSGGTEVRKNFICERKRAKDG